MFSSFVSVLQQGRGWEGSQRWAIVPQAVDSNIGKIFALHPSGEKSDAPGIAEASLETRRMAFISCSSGLLGTRFKSRSNRRRPMRIFEISQERKFWNERQTSLRLFFVVFFFFPSIIQHNPRRSHRESRRSRACYAPTCRERHSFEGLNLSLTQ